MTTNHMRFDNIVAHGILPWLR